MATEDSKRLRGVYAGALQRDPEERAGYLSEACAGEPELRARVEALLQAHSQEFAESEAPTQPVSRDAVEGKSIGPYIVRRELGRGGMGVVYLADDTRLSRRVALKAITPELGRDAAHRERLRHEARAAAALSHPGIATVYALEEIGDALYLAYEYVPGEPLRALLASGPLPIKQVVGIGAQLARALAAAHVGGVIHRDIKPENVMTTPSGAVKILDFGLARLETDASPNLTQPGTIVGTPAYMAPEQVLCQRVDYRSDLFAFGVLIYELACGKNPFVTDTISGTLGRIVETDPPPLSTIRRESLPGLDQIVATCLRKNPVERYQSTQDLVADFEQLESELAVARQRGSDRISGGSVVPFRQPRTPQWWWQFHQLIISCIYVLTIYPAWYAKQWLGQPVGMLLLLVILASAATGTSLRLHLRFIAGHEPEELSRQVSVSRRWTRICDAVFAAAQAFIAIRIATGHPEFAMLFVTSATATLVAGLVIEPVTERAAFAASSPTGDVPAASGGSAEKKSS